MAEGFSPPQGVRNNAKRGLELRREFGRGGTEIGVARARDLSNGKSIPLQTIRRMVSYFARHEVDKKGEGWGDSSNPSAGYIAWLLWGGDAGKTWANSISEREDKKEKSMNLEMASAFAEIIKREKLEDGTLLVYGKATDDSVDIDQQICDNAWLSKAMPEWFKTGGNIREQHSNIAAGVAKELDTKKDGYYIQALVVDPVSVKKVETGVLKGFSIGIRSPRIVRDEKAANGRIIDGQIVEVSLVDRPANPNAKLMLAKADKGGDLARVEEFIQKKEDETDYESINEGGKEGYGPADTELYNRVKREAKEKFDVYPSAVANAWVSQEYKKRGGKYRKVESDKTAETVKGEKMEHEDEKAVSEKPSKEEMLKQYAMAKENYAAAKKALDDCAKMCKEAGVEIEIDGDEDEEAEAKKQYGESAEEESEEGASGSGAEHELEEAEGKKKKSAEGEEASEIVEETPAEEEKTEEVKEDSGEEPEVNEKSITALINKAVKSAMDSIQSEIEALKSANEAAEETINKLEDELATAKTKAVAGGPKRTVVKSQATGEDEFLRLATVYRLKAAQTDDKTLAAGYKELANDFVAKAEAVKNK
jgi:hypothetical protein